MEGGRGGDGQRSLVVAEDRVDNGAGIVHLGIQPIGLGAGQSRNATGVVVCNEVHLERVLRKAVTCKCGRDNLQGVRTAAEIASAIVEQSVRRVVAGGGLETSVGLEPEIRPNAVGLVGNAIAEDLHAELAGDLAVRGQLGHQHFAICPCQTVGVEVAVVDEPAGSGFTVHGQVAAVGESNGERVERVVFDEGNLGFAIGGVGHLIDANGDPGVVLEVWIGAEEHGRDAVGQGAVGPAEERALVEV